MNSRSPARHATANGAGFWHRLWPACILFFCLDVQAEEWPQATNLWSFKSASWVANNYRSSTPAVAPDGTIYVGALDGTLNAISPAGKELWHFQAGREVKSSPAIGDDGTIYFGSRDHQLYAVTPGGKLKWKFATDGWVDSSPGIAVDGTICFGSWDKNFYALNPDGSLKWKFAVGGIVDSSPAIGVDGTIYFGAHNKKIYALDAGGQPRWTFLTGAEISSSPAIGDDGSIYFSSTDGNLYHLKVDGTEIWRFRTGGGSDASPVLAENGNIAIPAGTTEFLISPAGTRVWSRELPVWLDETAAVSAGTVLFPTPWRRLQALRPDGIGLWEGQTTENICSSLVIGHDGQVYFCCGKNVLALQPPVTLLPAKSPWPMFRADARHTGRAKAN